jgi:sec-independent protein translocase protein TatB
VDLRDLNPRTFVQKHLLDEVEPVIDDVKKDFADVRSTVTASTKDGRGEADGVKDASPGGPSEVTAASNGSRRILTPYDAEAT